MYNVNDINTELYVHHQHHGHHHQLGILESEASLIILFHLVLSCAAQLMSTSSASIYDTVSPLSMWPSYFVISLHNNKIQQSDLSTANDSAHISKCFLYITSWSRFLHVTLYVSRSIRDSESMWTDIRDINTHETYD